MIQPTDLKIVPPIQQTYGKVAGNSVPCYKIFFNIRGQGPYSVLVQVDGFTPAKAKAAIEEIAEPLLETLDTFK